MVSYYSLISIFPGSGSNPHVDVKFIDVSLYNISRKMMRLSVDYICNTVGKNNFVDTLSSEYKDVAIEKCPCEYVLKYGDDYTHQINIWRNVKVSGFLSTYTKTELVGTYAIIAAKETSKVVEKDFKNVVSELKGRISKQQVNELDASCLDLDEEDEEPEYSEVSDVE